MLTRKVNSTAIFIVLGLTKKEYKHCNCQGWGFCLFIFQLIRIKNLCLKAWLNSIWLFTASVFCALGVLSETPRPYQWPKFFLYIFFRLFHSILFSHLSFYPILVDFCRDEIGFSFFLLCVDMLSRIIYWKNYFFSSVHLVLLLKTSWPYVFELASIFSDQLQCSLFLLLSLYYRV